MSNKTKNHKRGKVNYSHRPRRATITVDVGEEGLTLLDYLRAYVQQTAPSTRVITRSEIVREAIQALYDRINSSESKRKEYTPT